MRVINNEYIIRTCTINRTVYYGADMEMAVFVNKEGNLRYYYWLIITMPRPFEVSL